MELGRFSFDVLSFDLMEPVVIVVQQYYLRKRKLKLSPVCLKYSLFVLNCAFVNQACWYPITESQFWTESQFVPILKDKLLF